MGDESINELTTIYRLELYDLATTAKDVNFREVWNDPQSIGVELGIRAGCVLARHSAAVPIKVTCLSGSGDFSYGDELENTSTIDEGTVIALDARIPHEVSAHRDLHLLVIKFK